MTQVDLLLILAAGVCGVVALITDNARFSAVGVLVLAVSLLI